MKLDFPLDPESIRGGIQEVVDDVLKETKWDLKRAPSKTKIKIGDAPEYDEFFGTTRSKGKLVFGKWLNSLEPEYVYEAMLEFLIVREAMAHFISEDILFGDLSSLTSLVLSIASMSYYQEMHKTKTINIKLSLYRTRLLSDIEKSSDYVDTFKKVNPLIDSVLKSGISYLLIINSYLYLIEDIDEIDEDEILKSLNRYIAKASEEIVFPIFLKESSRKILANLVKSGYDSTLDDVASIVGVDESIVSKELKKLDSRFRAKWYIEKNWFKLGLHSYIVIIRFAKSLKNNRDKMLDYLKKNHYFNDILIGSNDEYSYVYGVFHTSHFISERLASRLEKFQKDGSITSFDLKSITNRIYSTSVLKEDHDITLETYKKLLSGKIPHENLILWSSNGFEDKTTINLEVKDKILLKFLTFFLAKSITSYDVFGISATGFTEFLEENEINPNNITESVAFFKSNENQAKKRNLIGYRFGISLTDLTLADTLLVKINLNPDEKVSLEIMEKLSIFSSLTILKSYNDFYMVIAGLKYDHYITELIKETLTNFNVGFEIFSMKSAFLRNIAYNKLYDFNSKKWALSPLE